MEELKTLVRKVDRDFHELMRKFAIAAGIVVIFLMGFMAALQIQISSRNRDLDNVGEAAEDTRESTRHLQEVVDGVVEDINTPDPDELGSQEIRDGIATIIRLEQKLCDEGIITCDS